jgi:hypothetical protein
MAHTPKTILGGVAAVAILLGLSYCEEAPKYRFERQATEAGSNIAGARLISSVKTGDLTSPVSWFWPATTTFNFAVPDPTMLDRFWVISMIEDEREPSVFLIDADCTEHKLSLYALDQPETSFPAIDIWGQPVVAPNGKTYRQLKVSFDLPQQWIQAFCATDWTVEREAVAAARR